MHMEQKLHETLLMVYEAVLGLLQNLLHVQRCGLNSWQQVHSSKFRGYKLEKEHSERALLFFKGQLPLWNHPRNGSLSPQTMEGRQITPPSVSTVIHGSGKAMEMGQTKNIWWWELAVMLDCLVFVNWGMQPVRPGRPPQPKGEEQTVWWLPCGYVAKGPLEDQEAMGSALCRVGFLAFSL